MTIFARRSIQSFLTALRGTLTPHQLAALVDRLNLEDLDSLATEWEICILFALMNLGRIIYAPAFTGKSRPDVHFLASDDTDLQFIADVTLISDSDLEKNNPILELTQIISARARKLGIPGTFSFTVGSTSAGRHGARKVQLSIPHKKNLLAFINHYIVPQLRTIAKDPHRPREIKIVDAPWNLTLFYTPGQRFSHGSYRAFRNPTIKDKNPLFNALEAKRKQLRDSGYRGCKGIIVCDGGCEVITNSIPSWDTYSKKQILDEFFRKTKSISFVALIWINAQDGLSGTARRQKVCGEIVTNPNARARLPEELAAILKRLPEFWPDPVQTGETARLQLEGFNPPKIPRYWGRRVGGYKMGAGPNQITYRMSARELLEILSGRKTIRQFEEENGFAPSGKGPLSNPFENALRRGLTISATKLEPVSDRDDDWIEFRITGPDPALAPFHSPGQAPE
jgi:hypothetical protein